MAREKKEEYGDEGLQKVLGATHASRTDTASITLCSQYCDVVTRIVTVLWEKWSSYVKDFLVGHLAQNIFIANNRQLA